MADSYTEVSQKSWFGRIGESFKGILFGIVLFIGAIVLLFWNEGRAIKTLSSLEEGEKAVISIQAESVNNANEGKLVHLTGLATTEETLTDDQFSVSAKAIKLKRKVECHHAAKASARIGNRGRETGFMARLQKWSIRHAGDCGYQKNFR